MNQTYQEVANDPSSQVELRCKRAYSGNYDLGGGKITFYSYKVGDILPRTQIFLRETHWELAEKESV